MPRWLMRTRCRVRAVRRQCILSPQRAPVPFDRRADPRCSTLATCWEAATKSCNCWEKAGWVPFHQVTHKNVIRIYDLGDADGVKYITMEFVEGTDLRALIQERKKFPPAEAVEVTAQICRALEATHSVGVIHRDLKPQNIMRDKTGRILLMDFGLARTVAGDGMTQTGALVGTMEYMSPEQALAKDLDQRSDLFTLGLILYELLTGTAPYTAESVVASLIKRTQERAIEVSVHDGTIPRSLSNIVSKCLERDPMLRYQNAEELLNDLVAWQGKGGSAARISATSSRAWMNRLRELSPSVREFSWWRIVPVMVLLIGAVAATAWYFHKPQTATVVTHAPVSVLVADFQNNTSDPLFDGTLEPMFNVALEGATFINAYNRGNARQVAGKLPNPTSRLDEQAARLVAVSQGVSAIVTGALSFRGSDYRLSVEAIDAVTGKTLASAEVSAANKDDLLLNIPKRSEFRAGLCRHGCRSRKSGTGPERREVRQTRHGTCGSDDGTRTLPRPRPVLHPHRELAKVHRGI